MPNYWEPLETPCAIRLPRCAVLGILMYPHTIRFKGLIIELSPSSQPFTLGRDATSSMVVDNEWVSRNHATIEYKRGYFMIADRSTNGTFVKSGEDDELRLHRDEVHLRKTGTVSLGQ